MRRIFHKTTALLTAMICSAGSVSALLTVSGNASYAEEIAAEETAGGIIASGECGENLTWTITDNGVLTISGVGDMYDYEDSPWDVYNLWDEYQYEININEVIVEDGITSIGAFAFCDMGRLTSITIPDSIVSIGKCAFAYTAFNSINLSENLSVIEDYAFTGSELTEIVIPQSVENIGKDVFSYTVFLSEITVADGNSKFCAVNGVLYNADMTQLIRYPSAKADTVFTVPDTVTSIGSCAFNFAENLTDIKLPDVLEEIGLRAFDGCSSLENVNIPSGVKDIGGGAFADCSSLQYIALPSGITALPSANLDDSCEGKGHVGMFNGCLSLQTIYISGNIDSIGWYAFAGCAMLEDVYLEETETDWMKVRIGGYVFDMGEYVWEEIGYDYMMPFEDAESVNGIKLHLGGNTYMMGDIDSDGLIDISDATAALTIYAKQAAGLLTDEYSDVQKGFADTDSNDTVDISDATAILTYYARKAAGLDASWN